MKVGVIDIGTNSLKCVVYKPEDSMYKKELFRYYSLKLGEGVDEYGKLYKNKINQLKTVLLECKELFEKFNVNKIHVVTTQVGRIIKNINEINNIVESLFGVRLKVLSPEEEAELIYLAALYTLRKTKRYKNNLKIVVINIGGGSTEITFGIGTSINKKYSFPIGALSLSRYLINNESNINKISILKNIINNKLILDLNNIVNDVMVCTGGTVVTIGFILKRDEKRDYDKIDGYIINIDNLNKLIDFIKDLDISELSKLPGVSKDRINLLLPGAIILLELFKKLQMNQCILSVSGIFDGIIIKEYIK